MRKCDLCNSPAKLSCESDQASLCWECDAKVHSANFLVTKHLRILLCHVCQSLTAWHGTGPKFVPTVSVCNTCVNNNRESRSRQNHDEDDDDHNDDDDDDDDDDEMDDHVENDEDGAEEDDEENQVVPWTSTPPPPASASSNSAATSSTRSSNVEEGVSD
ncbi:zinc finger protein HD1-like [Vigna umbellata]|uniref:zinc finger protein HD1-like n=1 Tax=Vigna umbellata TaxID=87088 RepID=UPI001F5E80CF|nr:zinc finger protein HD1-like [Vigna umbellata]